jgi:hypothetical protein
VVVVEDVLISLLAMGARQQVAPRAADLNSMSASLRPSGQDAFASPQDPGLAPSTPASPAPHAAGELHDGTPLAREWAQRLAGRKLTVMEESGICRIETRGRQAVLELTTDRGERQGGELIRVPATTRS